MKRLKNERYAYKRKKRALKIWRFEVDMLEFILQLSISQ
jgi:hypothetical protein